MKRLLLGVCVVLALALLAAPAGAQKVSVGLKAGPNFSTVSAADIPDEVKSVARLIGGGFMVVQISPNFAFQPELLYAQKGFKEVDIDETGEMRFNYVEVPLLLRAQPTLKGRFLPNLIAGPTVAYNTGCDAVLREAGQDEVVADCDDAPIRDIDFGLAFGGGVDMAVGKAFIVLDLRYTLGLSNIVDLSGANEIKNRAFSVMAGFRYPLGGYTTTAAR